MSWRLPLAAVLALSAAACATLPSAKNQEAAARGRAFAQRACSQCHGLDAQPSPWTSAPPFASMQFRFNSILYERRVAELSHRHVSMPPVKVGESDLQDIAAYVAALKRQGRRAARTS